MKNKLLVILSFLFLGSVFFLACVHEIPHDLCSTDPIAISVVKTDATGTQNDGTITATATGGSGFQYSLNGAPYSSNGNFTGLAGNMSYNVVAKNSWGCTDTAVVDIAVIPPANPCNGVTITVTASKTDASPGQANGSITASATPAGTYTYSINSSAYQASGNFANLVAGNYTVTAKNADGCTGTTQVAIGTNDPCAGITVAVTATAVNPTTGQSNGSIAASATGGTGFTYSINNGPFQASGNFTGLAAGDYLVTAKNSNGCTGVKNVSLVATNPCAGITVTVTTTQVNPGAGQSNGSITASATGGTGFTYSLNNGAFQASGTFTGLATGNYTITAKNSNGCTGVATVALGTANPCTGVVVIVTATKVDPTLGQSNGSITATATGGAGFTYSLNNGAFQASGTFTGLAAGTYTVTAKSSPGCLGSTTVTLVGVNPCAGVTISVATTKVDPTLGQSNGSITATASGATGFTYSLNNGAYQASGTFSGLAAGTYTVTAKSSAGCLGSTSVTLTAVNPCTNTSIAISTAVVNVLPCASPAANGKITVTASGSSGYTYNINNGAYQASNIFSNLAATTYTVGVKDVNGCTKTASATVGTTVKGPLFTDVRTLITNRCGGSSCHMNGGNKAGYNFDNDCSIVTAWSAINTACVTSNSMPNSPQPLLTAAEKQKITNWINAGHTYGN
jgi:hypothetical protein